MCVGVCGDVAGIMLVAVPTCRHAVGNMRCIQLHTITSYDHTYRLLARHCFTLNSGRGVCVAGMGCSLQVIVCQVMCPGVVPWASPPHN